MHVVLNGEIRETPSGLTLGRLLEHFDLPKQRVAVELNLKVVRRNEWDSVTVADDDRIEVIHFVGGG